MKSNNYLFPFFWQHGESEEVLVEYVDKIYRSGMKAVCIESRPHPEFVGSKWWQDLAIIIRECQKRNMEIWILDDSHFPTGYANGKIVEEHPELLKQYLSMRRYDIAGPMKDARIDASLLKGRPWDRKQTQYDTILGVFLAKRSHDWNEDGDPIEVSSLVDISQSFENDTIQLDIPEGAWSVFVVFTTREGGEEATKDYLNPLDKRATQVLIDEVYEKHFQQVGDHFGTTIKCFFSDEPRFGNDKGTESWIGKPDMVLPWREDFEEEFLRDFSLLPLLWIPGSKEEEREVRYAYMNRLTKEYNENFTKPLADWCQNHNVEYLGHNIEDNGAHARLGYGAGHFFRGQEAQHYSGIDVIGTQIVPGMPYHHDAFQTGGSDGQFYHYALAKLGSSAAHLYKHKKGRAMCEAFGAYGWNEGLKMMKWIADHLIVRGINYIVPHAFSPKEYPDFDCPPHFYAHGNNPQFRYMTYLNNYLNRLMTLFNGGIHQAPVAILYPAELEWATRDYMPVEYVARALTESQIDFDIIPTDFLINALVINQLLHINHETFSVLIVPYASYIPKDVETILVDLRQKGLTIIFVNDFPKNIETDLNSCELLNLKDFQNGLSEYAELQLVSPFKELVYYHYKKDGKDYWLFFNESLSQTVDTDVILKGVTQLPLAYDAYQDKYYKKDDFRLILEPYQTLVWIFGENSTVVDIVFDRNQLSVSRENIIGEWQLSYASPLNYPVFEDVGALSELKPLNFFKDWDRKSGTVAYDINVEITDPDKIIGLDLGSAYETAEVFINGESLGVKIAPPYIFDIKGNFVKGDNHIRIEVTNTLGTEHRGGLNQYLLIEPFGLTTSVQLIKRQ